MVDIEDLLTQFSEAISSDDGKEESGSDPLPSQSYLKLISYELAVYLLKKGPDPLDEAAQDFICKLVQCEKKDIPGRRELLDHCEAVGRLAKAPSDDIIQRKIRDVKAIFKLSDLESKILLLHFLKESSSGISGFFVGSRNVSDLEKSIEFLSGYLCASQGEIRMALSRERPLRRYSLIEGSPNLKINQHILQILYSLDKASVSDAFFSQVGLADTFPLESFHLGKEQETALFNLFSMNRPVNVNIKGDFLTGKTELARTIAKMTGRKLYSLNPPSQDWDTRTGYSYQRLALNAATNSLDPRSSILLFDKADDFSNSEWGEDWAEELLLGSKIKQIWITLTRCDANIFLKKFNHIIRLETSAERLKTTLDQNARQLSLPASVKKSIAEKLPGLKTTPYHVTVALGDVKQMLYEEKIKQEEAVNVFMTLIGAENRASSNNSSLNPLTDSYLPGLLNTSVEPGHLIKLMKNFREQLLKGTLPPDIRNYNLLFYGIPGTGKTEFAKYISKEVGAPFIVKRSSDIIDKWVGESEKNIRNIFQQAEKEQAVLFLDECDSMFPNRENAVRSYEISRTNEMLVAMENFKGILICCTNFKDGLDGAAGRRFAQKIKFDYLLPENVPKFFESFLGTGPLESAITQRLRQMKNLAPGDFNNVRKRKLMEGIDSPRELMNLLEEEVIHKLKPEVGRRVGL